MKLVVLPVFLEHLDKGLYYTSVCFVCRPYDLPLAFSLSLMVMEIVPTSKKLDTNLKNTMFDHYGSRFGLNKMSLEKKQKWNSQVD